MPPLHKEEAHEHRLDRAGGRENLDAANRSTRNTAGPATSERPSTDAAAVRRRTMNAGAKPNERRVLNVD